MFVRTSAKQLLRPGAGVTRMERSGPLLYSVSVLRQGNMELGCKCREDGPPTPGETEKEQDGE